MWLGEVRSDPAEARILWMLQRGRLRNILIGILVFAPLAVVLALTVDGRYWSFMVIEAVVGLLFLGLLGPRLIRASRANAKAAGIQTRATSVESTPS
jgi:hypothetical protein